MPVDCVKLAKEFERLRTESLPARAVWDEIEKYVMPRVGATNSASQGAQGEFTAIWKNPDRWDATAPNGLRKLAAHVHGSMTPAGVQWFSGAFPQREVQEDKASREWIEGNAKSLWQGIEESDFQAEIAAAYREFYGLGNAFVVQEVDNDGEWNGLDYKGVPIRECEFTEDSHGELETWFHDFVWTLDQVADHCDEKYPLPESLRTKRENGSTEKVEMVFCIWEREAYDDQVVAEGDALPELRPWGGVYFVRGTGEQVGPELGYYDMPVFLARLERTPGSRWAHGYGHLVLPHARFVNSWLELVLGQGARNVQPAYASTEDGIPAGADLSPGKVVAVNNIDAFKELMSSGRIDVGIQLLESERAQIRRILSEDQLDLKDSPQMTAMEAQLRYDIMLKLLGPDLARLQSEFLDRMLLAAYRAFYRAGRFAEPPPLVKEKKAQMAFTYLGPTARARRADQVAANERGAAYAAALLKMGFEEIRFAFKPIESLRQTFEALGVPTTQLESEDTVKKRMNGVAQLQARQAKAETARAEGEAVQQAAEARQAAGGAGPVPATPPPVVGPPLM
jgi:hypothetical protein